MKKIVYAVLATVSGLVLLFSYRTSLEAVPPTSDAAAASTGTTAAGSSESSSSDKESDSSDSEPDASSSTSESDSSSSDTGSGTSSDAGTTQSSSGLADGTYLGQAASTRFGPVQVQITVSGGAITAADAIDYPTSNPRDRQINQIAVPRLVSETLSAQSAQIDMISGATYTSEGYRQSLQSAIDQASS